LSLVYNDTFVILLYIFAVYNGDELTHFIVSKTDDKIAMERQWRSQILEGHCAQLRWWAPTETKNRRMPK